MDLTEEGGLAAGGTRGIAGEHLLVPFIRGEADCHFWYDAGYNCPQTFVEPQRCFSFDDIFPRRDKSASFRLST